MTIEQITEAEQRLGFLAVGIARIVYLCRCLLVGRANGHVMRF